MKKTMTIALALVLVVALSVAGTFALFSAKTEVVSNTFAMGGLIPENGLTLKEHIAELQADGSYKLGTGEVASNAYTVVPGVNLPKDPYVDVTFLKDAPLCYLFVEVVSTLPEGLNFAVNAQWLPLKNGDAQVSGPNGGLVYVYSEDGATALQFNTNKAGLGILAGNQVTVSKNIADLGESPKLDFYAYLSQAIGVSGPHEAFSVFSTTAQP